MDQEDITIQFPVVLYNGERQVYVGKIEINPTINFQMFRTMLKQKTGVSYNNLTTYLVDNRRPETPHKILITSKVDFKVLMQQKDAYFLVVLKRSRRDRRRKSYHRNRVDLFDYGYETDVSDYSDHSSKVEYWLHDELEMESGKHNMHDNSNDGYGSNEANILSINEAYPMVERSLCEGCMQANEKGVKPEFHLCVYDEVVEGFFRSPAGPICRLM